MPTEPLVTNESGQDTKILVMKFSVRDSPTVVLARYRQYVLYAAILPQ